MIPWDTIATILSILVSIGSLAYWLGKKFAEINERFKEIDERFKTIDERFRIIDERFKITNERFKSIDERFKEIDEKIDKLRKDFRRFAESLTRASIEAHGVIIDYLGLKGLIEDKEVRYLRNRIRGVFETYMLTLESNPLTKEELEFIRRLFSKEIEEMTIEELNKAYEIGVRLFSKDFDYRGFLLAIAAAYIRAYLRQEYEKEMKKEK